MTQAPQAPQAPPADTTAPDPLAPWLRGLADAHASAHHVAGEKCRGSVALIDEAARLRGSREVRTGRALSLEREVETRPARLAASREARDAERRDWEKLGLTEMPHGHGDVELEVQIGVYGRNAAGGDVIRYDAHGVGNTHLDGLAHLGADATWHGGIPVTDSETDEDTMVAWARHGIATRGVVLDIPAVRGAEWVTAERPVTAEELAAALAATGVTLEPGDAVIVYQGRDRYEAAGNVYPSGAAATNRPGIGRSGAEWLAAQRLGLVVWDFHDARNEPGGRLEVHSLIYAIGLCLIDNALLGPAVAELRAAGRSSGLLVAAPAAIHRSTGVLINPLLLF